MRGKLYRLEGRPFYVQRAVVQWMVQCKVQCMVRRWSKGWSPPDHGSVQSLVQTVLDLMVGALELFWSCFGVLLCHSGLIRLTVLPCTALYCSQFIQLYCMQSSRLTDTTDIALISCCMLSPDYVERISGATWLYNP